MSVEEKCGVVLVLSEVRETVVAQTHNINKHGSFGRYDRLLARGSPAARYGWPQLYLLALCPIDLQQIGGFFTRRVLYSSACIQIYRIPVSSMSSEISTLPLFSAII